MFRIGFFLSLGLVALLGACSAIVTQHGYVPPDAEIALLEPGVDTRRSVIEKIGHPAGADLFQDQVWFYHSAVFETFGPSEPEVIERQILVLGFDEFGALGDISRLNLEDGRIVYPVPEYTPTHGRQLTAVQQVLGNLSNVSAREVVDQ